MSIIKLLQQHYMALQLCRCRADTSYMDERGISVDIVIPSLQEVVTRSKDDPFHRSSCVYTRGQIDLMVVLRMQNFSQP